MSIAESIQELVLNYVTSISWNTFPMEVHCKLPHPMYRQLNQELVKKCQQLSGIVEMEKIPDDSRFTSMMYQGIRLTFIPTQLELSFQLVNKDSPEPPEYPKGGGGKVVQMSDLQYQYHRA